MYMHIYIYGIYIYIHTYIYICKIRNIRKGASLHPPVRCTVEPLERAADSGIAKQVSAMLSLWRGHALFTISELGLANMQIYAKHLCVYIYIYICLYIYIYIYMQNI